MDISVFSDMTRPRYCHPFEVRHGNTSGAAGGIARSCRDRPRSPPLSLSIAGRTDVDLWLKDWYGCPDFSNGSRHSGLLIDGQGDDFLAKLDHPTSGTGQPLRDACLHPRTE